MIQFQSRPSKKKDFTKPGGKHYNENFEKYENSFRAKNNKTNGKQVSRFKYLTLRGKTT